MAINESVYGSPTSWANFGENISDIKVANFGDGYNLVTAVANGKLSYDSGIDKSIAFCGIGSECPFSNIVYFHGENGVITHEKKSKNISSYFFNSIPSMYNSYWNISAAYTLYDDIETFNYGVWSKGGDNRRNANNFVQPIADFKPQNIVLCIYVDCKQTQNGSISTVTLNDYINKDYYLQHPYVERVVGDIVVGNYTQGGANTRTTPLLTADFIMNVSTLEEFESAHIDKCYRYNSFQATNESCAPLLFSALRTINFAYSDIICFGDFTNDSNFEISQDNKNVWRMSYHVTSHNISDFKEMCLKAAAQYGLYFTDNANTASNGEFTDENMYIGILDSEGVTHGEYLKGKRTSESAQAQWGSVRESPYDYKKDDNTNYDNTTYFNYSLSSRAFTKMYVLTDEELSALANELYTAVHQAPTGEEIERYNQSVFLTQNPIDCIISLKQFPLELPFSVSQNIKLGSYTCNTTGAPLLYSTGIYSFIFSNSLNNTVYPVYDKSFLDYEPYTRCELTIPFCGTVEIPVSYIYNYDSVEVQLVIDYITGACTAYIQSNGITIDSVQGNCAISLPVSGIQAATLDSQIHTAATERNKSALSGGFGLIGGLAAVAIGIGTGGVGAAVMGGLAAVASGANMIYNDKKIEYDLQHMQMPIKQVGAASGAISLTYDMRCKMRITRPKLDNYNPEVYANTVGFACLLNGNVRDFHGLTSGIIKLDNVPCTAEEKNYITSMFTNGIYLP